MILHQINMKCVSVCKSVCWHYVYFLFVLLVAFFYYYIYSCLTGQHTYSFIYSWFFLNNASGYTVMRRKGHLCTCRHFIDFELAQAWLIDVIFNCWGVCTKKLQKKKKINKVLLHFQTHWARLLAYIYLHRKFCWYLSISVMLIEADLLHKDRKTWSPWNRWLQWYPFFMKSMFYNFALSVEAYKQCTPEGWTPVQQSSVIA